MTAQVKIRQFVMIYCDESTASDKQNRTEQNSYLIAVQHMVSHTTATANVISPMAENTISKFK